MARENGENRPTLQAGKISVASAEIPAGWVGYTKPVPAVGAILERAEHYTFRGAANVLIEAGKAFDFKYRKWAFVRQHRSAAIIGKPQVATGAEGYYVGLPWSSQSILEAEAKTAQRILDEDVKWHRYDMGRRRRVESLLHGQYVSDVAAIRTMFDYFHAFKTGVKRATDHMDSAGIAKNATFKMQTESALRGMTPMMCAYQDGGFSHSYALPPESGSAVVGGVDEALVRLQYPDGFELAETIGIAGHPVLRIVEQPKILAVLSANRAYGPPQGTPKRERLDQFATLALIESAAPFIPGLINAEGTDIDDAVFQRIIHPASEAK